MRRILVVEDSRTQAEELRLILEAAGFAVTVAPSAEQALAEFAASDFDLVLSDIVLPGLSGYELCRKLKAEPARGNVPVVLLTALNDPMDILQGLDCGADNYITKPYDRDALLERLDYCFANQPRLSAGKVKVGIEVAFMGKRFFVHSDQGQVLDLLIATCEDVVRTNRELGNSKAELVETQAKVERQNTRLLQIREKLEARVGERTAELSRANSLLRQEIEERRRAETQRDELLHRLQMQIERLPLAYLLLDADFHIVDWNPTAQKIFGYKKEEVLGMGPPFEKLIPIAERARMENIRARLQTGDMAAHAVNDNLTSDGRVITCEWHNTPLVEGGAFVGVLSVAQDVTGRLEAEETLRLRDRAIQAVSQGILITDPTLPDNPIIYASPGFERLTGYTQEEVLGRNCRFLQGPQTDPDTVAQVREAVRASRPCSAEILNYRKDGTPFWNALSISPVLDGDNQATHFVGVQADVTERRVLEAQFRQAQKMEAVGRLAGGVAHDFNNLITIINGFSELVLATFRSDDPARERVAEIKKAGERAASLTRQLLAFSRQQVLAPVVLSLNSVVTDLEKMLRRVIGEDIGLAVSLQANLGRVKADAGQIEQVIMNLAVNARDAMPRGGKLTIETKNIRLDEDYARLHADVRPGRYILLAVSDTGHGMTPEVQARIFEPFFTTKEKGRGTGLGLSMVFGIVKQSGGFLEVYSEPDVGTVFKVYLPRVEEPVSTGRSHQGIRTAVRGSETVLLAEDEDAVRTLTRIILTGNGYKVLEARDGSEAIRIAREHRGRIHLLISDVVMPGLGGRELSERLVALHPEMKVLFLSGYTDDAVVRHGVLQEKVNFLQKPFSTVALAQKVREVLDEAEGGGS
jgi:PAS domain S-box-containing protein